MNQSDAIDQLMPAFIRAQGKFKRPEKSRDNSHFKNKYSTLEDVWDATHEALASESLTIVQTMGYRDNTPLLVTTLYHSSGQWLRGEAQLIIAANKQDSQGMGSAITYMRRYSLMAMMGVGVDEDDDGNAASYSPMKKEPEGKAKWTSAVKETKPAMVKKHSSNPVMSELETQVAKATGLTTEYLDDFVMGLATKQKESSESIVQRALAPEHAQFFHTLYSKEVHRRTASHIV